MAMRHVRTSDCVTNDDQGTDVHVGSRSSYNFGLNPYGNQAQAELLHRERSSKPNMLLGQGEFVGTDGTVPLPPGCRSERPAEKSIGEKILRQMARQSLGPIADVIWPTDAQAPGLDCTDPSPGTLKGLGAPAKKGSDAGEPGIMVCNRPTDFGVGNHEYLWDKRLRESCGWGPNSRTERGPSVDPCVDIPGSAGVEQPIMDSCKEHEDDILWIPGVRDCHSLADQAQKAAGLEPVDLPRFGDPDRFWSSQNGEWRPMNPIRRLGRGLERPSIRGGGLGGEAGDGGPVREENQGGGGSPDRRP